MLRSRVTCVWLDLLTWNVIVAFSEQCEAKFVHVVLLLYLAVSSALDFDDYKPLNIQNFPPPDPLVWHVHAYVVHSTGGLSPTTFFICPIFPLTENPGCRPDQYAFSRHIYHYFTVSIV